MTNPIIRGAISGALGGLLVDINAYLAWSKAQDGLAYNWTLALSRLVQGAIAGAAGAAGLGFTL